MTTEQIKEIAESVPVIIAALVGAVGTVSSVLAHLPFPAVWAERFARAAIWAGNWKFSVNQRPIGS